MQIVSNNTIIWPNHPDRKKNVQKICVSYKLKGPHAPVSYLHMTVLSFCLMPLIATLSFSLIHLQALFKCVQTNF